MKEERKVESGGLDDLQSSSNFIFVGYSFYTFFLVTFTLAQHFKLSRKGGKQKREQKSHKNSYQGLVITAHKAVLRGFVIIAYKAV